MAATQAPEPQYTTEQLRQYGQKQAEKKFQGRAPSVEAAVAIEELLKHRIPLKQGETREALTQLGRGALMGRLLASLDPACPQEMRLGLATHEQLSGIEGAQLRSEEASQTLKAHTDKISQLEHDVEMSSLGI